MTERDCPFCDILEGKIHSSVITSTENATALIALEGHPIVIPNTHINNENIQMNIEIMTECYYLAYLLIPYIKLVYETDSVNILQNIGKDAGQEIDHYHIHLFPRLPNDKVVRVHRGYIVPQNERDNRARLIKSQIDNS